MVDEWECQDQLDVAGERMANAVVSCGAATHYDGSGLIKHFDDAFCLCCQGTDVGDASGWCSVGSLGDSDTCLNYYGGAGSPPSGMVAGQWSATATVASQSIPSPYTVAGAWSNINNALQPDGSYATVTLLPEQNTSGISNANQTGCCEYVSEYMILTGYGFSIPAGATIVGIGIGVKGNCSNTSNNNVCTFNWALTLHGTLYYGCDPSETFCSNNDRNYPYSPYGDGQGYEWPGVTDFVDATRGFDNISVDFNDTQSGVGPVIRDNPYSYYAFAPHFTNSPVKNSWLSSDVNDSSFGIAYSAACFDARSIQAAPCQTTPTSVLSVDAIGLAVFYVGGAAFCGGMATQAVGNPLID